MQGKMTRCTRHIAVFIVAVLSLPLTAAESTSPSPVPPERTTGQVMYMIGSTLMASYTTAIMESLTKNAGLPPAIIANRGSSRGIESFCEGVGLNTPDIVAVSRRIRSTEIESCRSHGVNDIVEIQVGYEASGIVSRRDDQDYPLTLTTLYTAIAAELPKDFNEFFPNKNMRWRDIDPELPNTEIRFVIPVPSLGGRGFMEDRILQGACRIIPEIKTIFRADVRVKQCITLRGDGRITEVDTPYDRSVVQTLASSPAGTLATIPLKFATEHQEFLKVQPFDGVIPNYETVSNKQYKFTRPLYFLVKKAHIKNYRGKGLVFGLREFITEATRESTVGPGGYLAQLGLFPTEKEIREKTRESSLRLVTINR